jgi:hypothetical protein
MKEVRYTGEDIAIGVELLDDDEVIIDPNTLDRITVYLVDQHNSLKEKYAYPEQEGYKTLTLSDADVSFFIESELTKLLVNVKLYIQLNLEGENAAISDSKQNTIAISDELIIRDVIIKEESL